MSDGTGVDKRVLFPVHPFSFETVKIINADDVLINVGGTCRDIYFTIALR